MHMLICITRFIALGDMTLRPTPALCKPTPACWNCHLCVVCFTDACLLAWHVKAIVIQMMSVHVCSKSVGHAEAVHKICMTLSRVECGRLVDLLSSRQSSITRNRAGNDVDTQYICNRGITHRKDAGRTLCCQSSSCL